MAKAYAGRTQPTLVVLILPELLPAAVPTACKGASPSQQLTELVQQLRADLHRTNRPIRVLIRVSETAHLNFAAAFQGGAVETQILVGTTVDATGFAPPFALLPRGGSRNERDDAAYALSDAVLIDPNRMNDPCARRARELKKFIIEWEPSGATATLPAPDPADVTRDHLVRLLPAVEAHPSIAACVDPNTDTWRRRTGRVCFGRFERLILEMFAFDLLNQEPGGRRASLTALWKCVTLGWRPTSFFAPDECVAHCPDPAMAAPGSPLLDRFHVLDRSALYVSHQHRDMVWLIHLLAALAVVAAVLGALYLPRVSQYAGMELGALLLILALSLFVRLTHLQDRWIACRKAAEEMRIALMCLPLLVIPPSLISEDTPPTPADQEGERGRLEFRALAEVKRVVRDYGVPLIGIRTLPDGAIDWVRCIVGSQLHYHRKTYRKLERFDRCTELAHAFFFAAALAAVVLEIMPTSLRSIFPHMHLLPLITASGPAAMAALYGASVRLLVAHRIAFSQQAVQELQPIMTELDDIAGRDHKTDAAWERVRVLTFRAAAAMGRENTTWQGQIRLQRDTLPS